MKKKGCLILLTFISAFAFAQQKLLTIEDAMLNARTTLAPENLRQLQFIEGTDDYVYLKKTNDVEAWMMGNFKSASETVFITLAQFNEGLRAASMDSSSSLPPMRFSKEGWTVVMKEQKLSYNSLNKTYKVLTDKKLSQKDNVDQSSEGYTAYLDEYNLFVSKGELAKQVTTDGTKDIVYASSVHREEFGISKGTFWSNDGKKLAFYRMDQTMVTDYPIIDWTTYPATNENIKYPMAGGKSHHVTVAVYNAETGTTTWLKTGEPAEQYLTNIAWSPDNKFVFIAIVNRAQNHMWLNQYDAESGDFVKTLFEETDSKYVEPLKPMLFVKNKPGQFIWESKKDGWNHLYLYDINGKLIKQLTSGEWEVLDVKGFDEKGENLLYVSTEESPITKNLYQLNLANLKTKRITPGFYAHSTSVSSDGQYAIDIFSSPQIPRNIQLIEIKSGKTKQLLQTKNPLESYQLGGLQIFTIKNNEGTPLYCRIFKPVNFDSTKKYPVIVYWYGGPHTQLIQQAWNGGAGDYWFQYMAERGYIVFSLDTRGSSNRGRAFEQSIFRHAGKMQMADMMNGIDYLKSLSYVDQNRMGLFGWSYGGFMTTDFMLNHPGVFKAAVAGGPVMDWKYYEIMYGERYMDTPAENPEGYEESNLIKQAGKLKGKLLLIHGLQDPVVVQQNSVNFVKAAVDSKVQVDYMIYPGHEHNVTGKDRAQLYQKVTDYFMQNLP